MSLKSDGFAKHLFDKANDAIFVLDIKSMKFIDVNPRACESLGYEKAELLDLFLDDVVGVSQEEPWEEWLEKLRKFEGQMIESMHRRKDGSTFDVEVSLRFASWDDRDVIIAIARDISKRKKAERELISSESRWKSLLANIPDIVLSVDKEGKILTINKTVPGLDIEKVRGASAYEFSPPEQAAVLKENVEKVFRTGEGSNFEVKGVGPHNTLSWYSSRIGPVVESGKVVAATIVTTDITAKKRDSEMLQMFSDAIKASLDGINITDMNGILTYCNETTERLFGYERGELLGRHVGILNPDDSFSKKVIIPSIKEKGGWSGELEQIRKDGSRFHVFLTTSIIKDENGKPIGMLGVVRDITDEKKSQEELEEAHKKLHESKKLVEEEVRKKTSELSMKAKELDEANKKLQELVSKQERRLKVYEVKNIPFNDNEKRCFHGLVSNPSKNDKDLAMELSIPRSTLTAIKNRLLEQGYFQRRYIPFFGSLGAEIISMVHFKVGESEDFANKFLEDFISGTPEFVTMFRTISEGFGILICKNISEFKRITGDFERGFNDVGGTFDSLITIMFPSETSVIRKLFDFSSIIANVLEIDDSDAEYIPEKNSPDVLRKLSAKEKLVLKAIVADSGFNDSQLSEKIGVPRVTIASVRNRLIDSGVVKMCNFPIMCKLPVELIMLAHLKNFNPSAMRGVDMKDAGKSIFFSIAARYETVGLTVFKDYASFKSINDAQVEKMKSLGIITQPPDFYFLSVPDLVDVKMDFSSITNKLLDGGA